MSRRSGGFATLDPSNEALIAALVFRDAPACAETARGGRFVQGVGAIRNGASGPLRTVTVIRGVAII